MEDYNINVSSFRTEKEVKSYGKAETWTGYGGYRNFTVTVPNATQILGVTKFVTTNYTWSASISSVSTNSVTWQIYTPEGTTTSYTQVTINYYDT